MDSISMLHTQPGIIQQDRMPNPQADPWKHTQKSINFMKSPFMKSLQLEQNGA